MSVPDPIGALVAFLKADADVAGEVGTRVFGGELPRGETASMPRKAIVLTPSGGGFIGSGYQEYGDIRVDLHCYGETPKEANDVWRAVHPALKQLRRALQGPCLLHWARPAGGPLTLRDPDADWPFTLATYQILVAEVAAA